MWYLFSNIKLATCTNFRYI